MPRKKLFPDVEYGSPEYHRLYRELNKEKLREYHREYSKQRYITHYDQEVARRKRWADKNKDKVAAHQAIHNAKRSKGIYWVGGKKGEVFLSQPCSVCEATPTNAHHEDYSKPLDVVWLCPVHHSARHKELGV